MLNYCKPNSFVLFNKSQNYFKVYVENENEQKWFDGHSNKDA